MISYIHGSEDSLDTDIYYVFDEIPEFNECRKFCSENPDENRNIIVIKDGVVTDCFIGTCDEINNGLIDTYNLHEQKHPLIVTKRVERDKEIKYIRAMRGILSNLSKTHYRPQIKESLNSNWNKRLECLRRLDFRTVDWDGLGKRMNKEDVLKVIAFQIGQSLGLLEDIELYTKSSVAKQYPDLNNFLYRKPEDLNILNSFKDVLCDYLSKINVVEINNDILYFPDKNKKIDMRHEKYIEENVLER